MDTIFNDVCVLVTAASALTLVPGFRQPERSLLSRRDQGTALLVFLSLGLLEEATAAGRECGPTRNPILAACWSAAAGGPARGAGLPVSVRNGGQDWVYRQEPCVMISSQRSPTFRRHAIDLCAKHCFVPKIVQEANDVPTLMALARAGIGLTFLPASACKRRLVGVKVHPIPDPEAIWSVGAVWRRAHRSIVLARFLDLLDKELVPK